MTQTTCFCLACDPKSGEIGRECTKPAKSEWTIPRKLRHYANSMTWGERRVEHVMLQAADRIEKLENELHNAVCND